MCPHVGILGLISLMHRLRDLLGTGILLALEGPSLLPKPRALTHMLLVVNYSKNILKTSTLTMITAVLSICEAQQLPTNIRPISLLLLRATVETSLVCLLTLPLEPSA